MRAVAIGGLLPRVTSSRQFIRADAKGHVYLLNGDSLSVYPLKAGGKPGSPSKLELLGEPSELGSPLGAALSPAGDAWLLHMLGGPRTLRYFENGKEQLLSEPPPWRVMNVGLPDGVPVLAIAPVLMDTHSTDPHPPWPSETPPLLMQWSAGKWTPYAARVLAPNEESTSVLDSVRLDSAASETLVANGYGERHGAWIAQLNFYHVRHLSPAGRVTATIVEGPAKVEMRDRSPAEKARVEQLAKEMSTGALGFAAKLPQRAILGAAEGADGLFLLVERSGKPTLAIDHYDSTAGTVERAFLTIPAGTSIASFAAGSDGLYIASPRVENGAWWLPWEELSRTTWQPVADAEIK